MTHDVGDVLLVKCTDRQAVLRTSSGLELIRIGDHLGRTRAVVKELAPSRMVLEETLSGKDGTPNRALIILEEGKRGGTRYLQRSEEPRLVGVAPVVAKPTPAKKP